MNYDDMLEELGELGLYQIRTYLLVCLPVMFGAANSLTYVFTAGIPEYRCFIPGCDHLDNLRYNQSFLEYTIPDDDLNVHKNYKPALCERYSRINSSNETCDLEEFSRTRIEKCDQWVFGEERTIVNDWKITCLDNQWMLSLVGTMHFVGIITGTALFGALADRFGRKPTLILATTIMSITGVLQIVSPNYVIFLIFVLLNALGTSGIYPLGFVIGVELVGRKQREVSGTILNYFYAIGEALVGVVAWLTKDWALLQLIASGPAILFVTYFWFLPESVRWLLARGENVKAKKLVYNAAHVNKKTLSKTLEESFAFNALGEANIKVKRNEEKILPLLKQIFKCRKLVIRFLLLFIIWAINAFVFYGLSVNSTSMGGDKYLNFILVCLVEIPGYTIGWVIIKKFGRKPALIVSMFVCAVTCVGTVFIPPDCHWAIIMLFLIGKLAITSSFGIVYVYTSEVLPTIIRSGGVGAASTSGRCGALLAPFVPLLGVYVHSLPMLLFGGLAILAGILTFKLPETLGVKLPETFEEAEAL